MLCLARGREANPWEVEGEGGGCGIWSSVREDYSVPMDAAPGNAEAARKVQLRWEALWQSGTLQFSDEWFRKDPAAVAH